ncbi:polysaccharide pyruvyl transferase family protein [Serratia rubidaea]|uniref:Polysaccharide pyruvyl transferase family protein n=1 Tax=Serratia rubidaea TaxID=61652 RepID=A0ABS0M8L7_SERRU|nr:polysaccharide pyruvyl transferase family protein [Serratia rubidaea]MBH1928460.1 polysaccharide pyruvyl transferase family protein [Serratia rubidaea]
MFFFTQLWKRKDRKDVFSDLAEHKTFYLVSAAGMPNFGDDMLTRYWIEELQQRFPGCTIYLDAVDAVVAAKLFPHIKCVDYLWRLAQALGNDGSIEDKFSDRYTMPLRERLMSEVFNSVESIHLLGGGYINELWGANRRLVELVAYFGKINQIHCYATGLGLLPLSSENAAKMAPFIRKFTQFDVRDKASYDVLAPFELPALNFSGDDYFSFPLHPVGNIVPQESATLHLCIHTELSENEVLTADLLALLQPVAAHFCQHNANATIRFYEFRPGSDGVFFQQVQKLLPTVEFVTFEQIWQDGLAFSTHDYCISSRFHFQVIAASLGVAGVSLSWSDYYDNKFSSLKQISDWPVLRPDVAPEVLISQLFMPSPSTDRKQGKEWTHQAKARLLAQMYNF